MQTLFKPGQTLAGRYRVRSVLGTGASGVVYGVFDTLSERNQALKVLWDGASGDDPELKRLRREIRASQLAPCSRLVAIHDLVMIGERPALVMEWVEGETLREKIKREGPLSWREAAAAAAGILEGLAHLHGLGIVHRDVKTGNILLGPDGGVKVGDFGLAKGGDLGASLTQPGAALGTPGYMAPEVIRGKPATSRSDLYSVGVVLFEMLTGLLPHRGTSALEIASRQLADPPPLHLLKERNVPRWLARIVARLLERDPGDRFPSAKTTLAALNKRSAGFSVARRWRRRSAAAAAVLLALGGLLAAYFWFTAQAPLDLTFHGRTLQAHSPSGRLLWSRKLPRDIQSALYGRFGPGGTPAVAAAITWDRHAATMEVAPDQGNVLYLLDRHGKTLDSVGMGLAHSPFEPHYDIHLTQHRFSSDGHERLVRC
ncbi:MAG: serine/threonine-protein kinase [Acidobacteriota bacterium]